MFLICGREVELPSLRWHSIAPCALHLAREYIEHAVQQVGATSTATGVHTQLCAMAGRNGHSKEVLPENCTAKLTEGNKGISGKSVNGSVVAEGSRRRTGAAGLEGAPQRT